MMLQAKGDREAKAVLAALKEQIAASEPSHLFESLSLLEENTYPDLKQLTIPLLHIYGEQDALVPLGVKEEIERRVPANASVVFNQCGHVPFMHDAKAFVAILEAHVKKVLL